MCVSLVVVALAGSGRGQNRHRDPGKYRDPVAYNNVRWQSPARHIGYVPAS